MNSLRKSVGKYFHFGAHGLVLITLVGCATSKQSSRPGEASRQVKDALSGEISLKSDRAALEELRKDIPEQKKQSNDELALVLELFGTVKLPPSEVQGKYQIAMQKRREIFRNIKSPVNFVTLIKTGLACTCKHKEVGLHIDRRQISGTLRDRRCGLHAFQIRVRFFKLFAVFLGKRRHHHTGQIGQQRDLDRVKN